MHFFGGDSEGRDVRGLLAVLLENFAVEGERQARKKGRAAQLQGAGADGRAALLALLVVVIVMVTMMAELTATEIAVPCLPHCALFQRSSSARLTKRAVE